MKLRKWKNLRIQLRLLKLNQFCGVFHLQKASERDM